jgi:hypothetical protein
MASIGSTVSIGSETRIRDGARIGPGAHIGDKARPTCIYITGPRFPVSYWGEDRIDIGCKTRSISDWLNDYTDIAAEYNLTVEDIIEYREYVKSIKTVHDKISRLKKGGR